MKNNRRSLSAGIALIVLLTGIAYIPVMRGGFVFDDHLLITDNRTIKASDGLYRFWFTTEAPDYYPLTWSLCWLEWRLWGDRPAGYHAVNVLLHAVNAVLVWMILRRLRIPAAWLVGLMFALHPVNVASVAWISEQKNTLSMLFYTVAILLYLRFDKEHHWSWYGLSLAAFLLALLSKTAVVMLPVALLLCIWWHRGRLRWKDFLCSVPFFVLSLILGCVTIWFQYNRALGGWALRMDDFLFRLVAAGRAPWFYLYKAVWPFNLAAVYPKWDINPSRWESYVPGVMLAGCLTLFWWKRQTWGRPLFFGLGYFVVVLWPVLGFLDQGFYRYSFVADHWQYVSIVAPIALVVAAGKSICRRMGQRSRYANVLTPLGAGLMGAAVLMLLGMATWKRAGVYATDETLWRDTLAKNPQCWLAHNNLGLILWQSGKVQEAIEHYEQALRMRPHYAEAHHNLGLALAQTGDLQEAIKHFGEVARIKPDSAEAHRRLGMALQQAGHLQEAAAEFKQALRMKPDSAGTYNNLGNAALQTGRFKEAVEQYEQALRLNPNIADVQNNLAWLLATLAPTEGGDPVRAVILAEQACELTDNRVAAYLDTRAAAYAAVGRFNDAAATARKAVELARSDGQPQLAREIESRLELYRSGRVCRQPVDMSRP